MTNIPRQSQFHLLSRSSSSSSLSSSSLMKQKDVVSFLEGITDATEDKIKDMFRHVLNLKPSNKPSSFFHIPRIQSINLLQVAGQSTVYLVEYKDLDHQVIFKIYNRESTIEDVKREVELAKLLKQNLQKFKGINREICEDFILEYSYDETNPKVLIGKYAGQVIPNYRIHRSQTPSLKDIDNLLRSSIITDTPIGKLASIIHCIHQMGFYHRDIKPDNFLITTDNKVYLIDFGVSLMKDEIKPDTLPVFSTVQYRSPFMKDFDNDETSVSKKKEILIANDIWALICTIFYYYIGNHHWYVYTNHDNKHSFTYIHIMDNIMDKDPSTYVTDRGKLSFFKKYFYLERPSTKKPTLAKKLEKSSMPAEKYISIMEKLISISINRGSFKKTKRKTKRKKNKIKKKLKKTKRQRI